VQRKTEAKMNRFKGSMVLLIIIYILFCGVLISKTYAWENLLTHPGITNYAIERSILNSDYLQTHLGLSDGLQTKFSLPEQYQNELITRSNQLRPPIPWNETELSIRDWIKRGSYFEDVPNPRARHHFHSPIANLGVTPPNPNAGLNNPGLIAEVLNLSILLYPAYWPFDATGASTLDRARGTDSYWEGEYTNNFNWPHTRDLFYSALTEESKDNRDKDLGAMFVALGHICHLIEDMGVPAHTRNDFVWGHLVGGFYNNVTGQGKIISSGNPFEIWMENQMNNTEQIPPRFIDEMPDPPTPPAFSKLAGYWDTDLYSGAFTTNGPLDNEWGLAECTNYQFLSYSSLFKTSGLQSYPNPDKNHTQLNYEMVNGKKRYYYDGYFVPHLARLTYSQTCKNNWAPSYDYDYDSVEDLAVFEDYAARTIPRTIDYVTGLINYFFRGKISAEVTGENEDGIELSVTNISDNSGVTQVLKGGTFELYWDDQYGTRTPLEIVSIKDSDGYPWDSSSILGYNQSAKITFSCPSVPEGTCAYTYIVVYKGAINDASHPDQTDSDDEQAYATASFSSNCNPPEEYYEISSHYQSVRTSIYTILINEYNYCVLSFVSSNTVESEPPPYTIEVNGKTYYYTGGYSYNENIVYQNNCPGTGLCDHIGEICTKIRTIDRDVMSYYTHFNCYSW
jgi:hypothetical protein